MKTKFTLLAFLVAAFFAASAQTIPNAGFETWTSPLNPDGWATYSSAFGTNIGLAAKDTADKAVGTSSIRIYNDSVPGQPAYGVVGGLVSLGSASFGAQGASFKGVPFPYRPDTLFFAYKYTSTGADTAGVTLVMTKNGATVFAGGYNSVGFGLNKLSQWGLIYAPITSLYANGTITPDSLIIQFTSSVLDQPIKGSELHVDQVFFSASSPATGINDVSNNIEVSIFPNPATDQLNITADLNLEGHQVVITDMNGKLVRIRPLTNGVNSIELSDVASGNYIYRIADKAGRFIKQDRFTVAK
jgi:hypothetical protein